MNSGPSCFREPPRMPAASRRRGQDIVSAARASPHLSERRRRPSRLLFLGLVRASPNRNLIN